MTSTAVTDHPHLADRRAVADVLAGDVDAFEPLVRRYQPALLGYLRCHAPSPSEGDDLAQLAFVAAFEQLARYDAGQPFEPWLHGIARNLLRRAWTRAGREARQRDALLRHVDRLVDAAPPLEPAAARLEALRDCLAELPERWARIVGWRYEDRQPLREIACALGNSPSSVGVTPHRIRARLRECVERRLAEVAR